MEATMGFFDKAKEAADRAQERRVIGPILSPEEIANAMHDEAPDDAKAKKPTARGADPKKPEKAAAEAHAVKSDAKPRQERAVSEANTTPKTAFLGSDLHFEGTLRTKRDIRIDGHTVGRIEAKNGCVAIGPGGKVESAVEARNLVVAGSLHGNVKISGKVVVRGTGRMRGELETPSLVLEEGAVVEGKVQMGKPAH
jgi:cytoskeletal protein CcmA (bactofilin family)